jgi:hypothetical protein
MFVVPCQIILSSNCTNIFLLKTAGQFNFPIAFGDIVKNKIASSPLKI